MEADGPAVGSRRHPLMADKDQPAPDGSRIISGNGEPWVDARNADGIGYLQERPAWFLRVVHPARFKGIDHDVEFKAFVFPTSALIAVLLRFLDDPSNPYCFHRVFDVADPQTLEFLGRVARDGAWRIMVNSRGSEPGFMVVIPIAEEGLPARLRQAQEHLSGLSGIDGKAAIDEFLRLFKEEGAHGGFHSGWRAVEAWLARGG